ncbi:hypothetical protein [Indioceanicola profundi]|uniref:hypothetical protein n=1 Tax=Indioceanicola profundi TaxID=2220096 RepID=UPI001CED753D|nr:hypothetical protein [Indioceanicola profundi]
MSFVPLPIARYKLPLNGLIWPKVGCASIAYAATAPIDFLPLSAARPFLASQESRSRAILR